MKSAMFRARKKADRRGVLGRGAVRGITVAACVGICGVLIGGAAVAQNQVMGGHVLDSNLRQGSLGLNSTIYRPGTYPRTVEQGGGPYGVGWGSGGLAVPMYRVPQSAQMPAPRSYLYQSPGTSTGVLITGRRGGTYVDPLASTMYTPLQSPLTVQRYDPTAGQTTGVQIQPYGSLFSPLYSPFR